MNVKFMLNLLIVVMATLATTSMGQVIRGCARNCKSCWGSRETQCMSCQPGYFMQGYKCHLLEDDGETEPCAAVSGYRLDRRDMICKRTVNDIDFPCAPSTYNPRFGASSQE